MKNKWFCWFFGHDVVFSFPPIIGTLPLCKWCDWQPILNQKKMTTNKDTCTCDIGDAIDDIGHFAGCPMLNNLSQDE